MTETSLPGIGPIDPQRETKNSPEGAAVRYKGVDPDRRKAQAPRPRGGPQERPGREHRQQGARTASAIHRLAPPCPLRKDLGQVLDVVVVADRFGNERGAALELGIERVIVGV